MFFGSKKIPELAKGLGKAMREVKDASNDIKKEINDSAKGQGIDTDLTKDIKKEIGFVRTNPFLKFEVNNTSISASVRKFTEKTVSAFINIKNLPDSLAIKLFPQSVAVTFSVLLDLEILGFITF